MILSFDILRLTATTHMKYVKPRKQKPNYIQWGSGFVRDADTCCFRDTELQLSYITDVALPLTMALAI